MCMPIHPRFIFQYRQPKPPFVCVLCVLCRFACPFIHVFLNPLFSLCFGLFFLAVTREPCEGPKPCARGNTPERERGGGGAGGWGGRERKREGERERERGVRHSQTDTDTDRKTQTQTQTHTETEHRQADMSISCTKSIPNPPPSLNQIRSREQTKPKLD
jgi:hypothetical protein